MAALIERQMSEDGGEDWSVDMRMFVSFEFEWSIEKSEIVFFFINIQAVIYLSEIASLSNYKPFRPMFHTPEICIFVPIIGSFCLS